MKKALIAAGIGVAIVIAIVGAYASSLTEPTPEGAIESTTPQPIETITQQTGEQPAESTPPEKIVIKIKETIGYDD